MNRRCAIRQLVTVTGGFLLLHSCMEDRTKGSFLLKHYSLSADQENLLAMLAETILPKTTTPGAKDIYAHQFVMKMIDDCTPEKDRERFLKGLGLFSENARKVIGTAFHQTDDKVREAFVQELNNQKEEESDEKFFYKRVKHLTIRAYTSSKFYLTDVQPYELVPSRWSGCVAVS